MVKKHLIVLFLFLGVLILGCHSTKAQYYSSKGQWGRVVPIADNNHPNLYYNQREIDELRKIVLVQHTPALLWDLWNNRVSGMYAQGPSSSDNPGNNNIGAALSYMLEPTDAKADAIRSALLDFVKRFPNGGGRDNGGDCWWKAKNWFYSGYSVPWLYDLLMAYHPQKLSRSEVSALKNWFHLTAGNCRQDNWSIYTPANDHATLTKREGKTVAGYHNWWTRHLGNGFAAALMSGNQDDVDYWFDSGWPHDKLFYDESWTPAPGQHQFDMVMTLLAVFPSGANEDTYLREGYRLPQSDWNTRCYSHGIYHFANMYGAILAAEAAYHNGMTDVYKLTDAGEPALLRTYKRAIASRNEVDNSTHWSNDEDCKTYAPNPGQPIIGWDPIIYLGYRRYADPMIENAILDIPNNGKFLAWPPSHIARNDLSTEFSPFFGYPRHTVGKRKYNTSSS